MKSLLALLMLIPACGWGQDTLFTADIQLLSRGEIRNGGMTYDTDEPLTDDKSAFILERERLTLGYKRSWLEVKTAIQHVGTWGHEGAAGVSVYEAWGKATTRNGFFAQIGRLVLRKSFRFITVAMAVTCLAVWIDPQAIAALFGADNPAYIAETNSALRIFALSFIPFCYIYVLMIVYKLYGHHHMALFVSFALSLTVIPVMWIVSRTVPSLLWYSYLMAYLVEVVLIVVLHRLLALRFTFSGK